MEEELHEAGLDERTAVSWPLRRSQGLPPERRRCSRLLDEDHDLGDTADGDRHPASVRRRNPPWYSCDATTTRSASRAARSLSGASPASAGGRGERPGTPSTAEG